MPDTLISFSHLERLERSVASGGALVPGSSVYVHARNPIEAGPGESSFAKQILKNLQEGIRYRYFMPNNAEAPVQLIERLLKLPDREGSSSIISDRLELIARQLRIVPLQEPWPFTFCVHNAKDHDKARCYLRMPEQLKTLALFAQGDRAAEIVYSLDLLADAESIPAVLQPRSTSPLTQSIRVEMVRRVDEAFPGPAGEQILSVFLGS